MPDIVKPSTLTPLATPASGDYFVIQDISEPLDVNKTKSITYDNLMAIVNAAIAAAQAFKVGDLHFSTVSTNPATTLGYGTWTLWGAGKVPVCVDITQTEFNTVEKTGGAKTHALSAAENGVHTHIQDAHNHLIGELWHMASGGDGWMAEQLLSTPNASTQNATATNQNSGSGTAHNNLQPYLTCYIWKRTA